MRQSLNDLQHIEFALLKRTEQINRTRTFKADFFEGYMRDVFVGECYHFRLDLVNQLQCLRIYLNLSLTVDD